MMLFESICKAIEEDEKRTQNRDYGYITIEERDANHITVYDAMDSTDDNPAEERRYTIHNPESMDRDYFSSLVLFSDSAKDFLSELPVDKDSVVDYLNQNMDKNMLMTVDRILFVTDEEEDTDSLFKNERIAEATFEAGHWFPCNGSIGLTWWDYDIICINVKAIKEVTDDLTKEYGMTKNEVHKELNYGVLGTLVHEVRHTAQDNPYLPEEILQFKGADKEDDAERYARDWVDTHYREVVKERKRLRSKAKAKDNEKKIGPVLE